jgi:hypothetical protein
MSNWKIINKQNIKTLWNKKDLESLQVGLRNSTSQGQEEQVVNRHDYMQVHYAKQLQVLSYIYKPRWQYSTEYYMT